MSISGIGSSMNSAMSSDIISQMREARGNGNSKEELVSSIFEDNDADGDGLLNLKETGMSEDKFTAADTDADGQISEDELLADMERHHEEKARMGELSVMMQGGGQENLIDSIMNELDLDGDSQLTMEESGLSEDLFNVLDSDSDGNISSEELEATLPPPPPAGAEEMAASAASSTAGSGSTESSSSSDSEEEYDEYDLNQDGVVSSEELRQAFMEGDQSLAGMFAEEKSQGQGSSKKGEVDGQSMLTRMAMRAYEQQNGEAYTVSQGAVV